VAKPYRFVQLQTAIGLVFAGVMWNWSQADSIAALLGVASLMPPKAWFAWKASRAGAAELLASGVAKFFAELGFVAIALWWFKPSLTGFVGAIVLIQAGHLVGALFINR
tara:strand:- start:885 stop:1211 length:327 start_codon:yes stop_codon:yes gene_type:complete